MEIDPLHTVAHGGEDFVGDAAEAVGERGDGQMVAKDFHAVAFTAGDVRDINHAHVHADVAHIGRAPAIDEAESIAISQAAVESVGIANGDGSDARGTVHDGAARVAHGSARLDVARLEDGGVERGHVGERHMSRGRSGKRSIPAELQMWRRMR